MRWYQRGLCRCLAVRGQWERRAVVRVSGLEILLTVLPRPPSGGSQKSLFRCVLATPGIGAADDPRERFSAHGSPDPP